MRFVWTDRVRASLAAISVLAAAFAAHAQSTLDHPLGEVIPFALDSGAIDNAADEARTVWAESAFAEGSAWVRLHLGAATLPTGSYLRITSLLDGETQELGAAGLAMWRYTSAYFNGEEIMVELVAGARTAGNRVVIDHLTGQYGDVTQRACGICNGNDREPSDEAAMGRLMPTGCSASVYCEDGGLLSAGHCGAGSDVVEFNVPPSNSDCTVNHPPVDDQFPIIEREFSNSGPGNDWAVFTTGPNGRGESIFDRYGVIAPIATAPVEPGAASSVVGYGAMADCERAYTQQLSPGVIKARATNVYRFDNDVRPGSSGSPLIVDGATVGVITHCTDSCDGLNGNLGTRIDRAEFVAARESMSVCEIPDVEVLFETSPFFIVTFAVSPPDHTGSGDGQTPFGRTWDEGTMVTVSAPAEASDGWCFREWRIDGAFAGSDTTLVFEVESGVGGVQAVYEEGACGCVADFNGDGTVDTRDVLSFLNAWSAGEDDADVDGNGVVDSRDVLAFLNLWNAGC